MHQIDVGRAKNAAVTFLVDNSFGPRAAIPAYLWQGHRIIVKHCQLHLGS